MRRVADGYSKVGRGCKPIKCHHRIDRCVVLRPRTPPRAVRILQAPSNASGSTEHRIHYLLGSLGAHAMADRITMLHVLCYCPQIDIYLHCFPCSYHRVQTLRSNHIPLRYQHEYIEVPARLALRLSGEDAEMRSCTDEILTTISRLSSRTCTTTDRLERLKGYHIPLRYEQAHTEMLALPTPRPSGMIA